MSPLCHQHGGPRQYQHQHSTDTSTRSSITPDLWTLTPWIVVDVNVNVDVSININPVFKCTTYPHHTSQFTCQWHLEGQKKARRDQTKKTMISYKMEYSWKRAKLENSRRCDPILCRFEREWKISKDLIRSLFVWTSPFYLITTVEWSTNIPGE